MLIAEIEPADIETAPRLLVNLSAGEVFKSGKSGAACVRLAGTATSVELALDYAEVVRRLDAYLVNDIKGIINLTTSPEITTKQELYVDPNE